MMILRNGDNHKMGGFGTGTTRGSEERVNV